MGTAYRSFLDTKRYLVPSEVLYAKDVQGEEISHTVVLEEKTSELDEGQVGSDPEEPGKTTVETKAESMVTVPIHQASTSVPSLSIPIIDLSPPKLDKTTQALSSRIFTLELKDLPYKINQTVNEAVTEAVHVALQAPFRDRFKELPEADIKEILHQWMFESGTYKSLLEHVALYEALEAYMELEDVPIPDDMNISDSEDTDTAYLPKIKIRPDWLKPILEEDRPATPELDWIIPPNDLPEIENNWANALASSYQDPMKYKLL
ncbi:hypothetical protein Tco_0926057 [Tanacetum coccineum]|uniref:Uncharacterized protein n=1 Tax=Tanacetum coccineum TaxID=301880 RepID=A0ABQ5DBF7_9ASTR